MSSQRVNANASEKDVEKFIKFLVQKSAQVVVESRLGEKIQTPCNPHATGNDWFNIAINDHAEIYAETKRALALEPGQSILQRLPLCIEISLRTVEGDYMVLEVWSLDLQPPRSQKQQNGEKSNGNNGDIIKNGENGKTTNGPTSEQQTLRTAQVIYNCMGKMLRSLISLTRTTPAYKLSRRQCPESYRIYYRIYVDRPQIHTLGEGMKQHRIGQINTIVGALSMSVAYRTKMTITPTTAQGHNGDNAIMLKSDHFRRADVSPTMPMSTAELKKGTNGVNGERQVIDIEKPLRPGAFTDVGKLRQYTEKDYVLPETPPFEWLLPRARHESGGSGGSVESLNRKSEAPCNGGQEQQQHNDSNATATNNNNNVDAFKSFENDEHSGKSPATGSTLSQSPIKSLLIPTPAPQSNGLPSLPALAHALDDDNLLRELSFPFAASNSHVNDLAKFYRDCYHAPPLRGLSEIQPEIATGAGTSCSAEAFTSVGDDVLEQFETLSEDFDKLVSQLGLSTSSSTGSRSSGGLQMSN